MTPGEAVAQIKGPDSSMCRCRRCDEARRVLRALRCRHKRYNPLCVACEARALILEGAV